MRFVPSFSPLPLIVNLQYILPMNLTIYQQNCHFDQSPSYKTDYTHNCYKSWLDNFWFIMGLKRSKCFVCGWTFGSGQVTWLCLLLTILTIGQVHNYLLHYRHLLKCKKQKMSVIELILFLHVFVTQTFLFHNKYGTLRGNVWTDLGPNLWHTQVNVYLYIVKRQFNL